MGHLDSIIFGKKKFSDILEDIGVKNDEALIKMATIIQRALQNQDEDGGFGISDDEKTQLLEEMEKLQKNKDK